MLQQSSLYINHYSSTICMDKNLQSLIALIGVTLVPSGGVWQLAGMEC